MNSPVRRRAPFENLFLGIALSSTLGACLFERLEDPGARTVACGPTFAEGNVTASGVEATDSYLLTARAWLAESAYLETEIEREADQLQADFAIAIEATMSKPLGTSIRELMAEKFGVQALINASRPTVLVDARAAFLESAICQRSVGCNNDVDPSELPFACRGSCESTPGQLDCGEPNRARCIFSGPDVACDAECVGLCEFDGDDVEDCAGVCRGICQGFCSQQGDADRDGQLAFGECVGSCDGTCQGHCQTDSAIGGKCKGTCSGDCVVKSATLDCADATQAFCDSLAGAAVACTGQCRGDFDAPEVLGTCEASYACNSQAKVDEFLRADWTAVELESEISINTSLSTDDQRALMFMQHTLEERLPRLLLLAERAQILATIGEDLGRSGIGVEEGAFALLLSQEDLADETRFRLTQCAASVFDEAAVTVTNRLDQLNAALARANSVRTGLVVLD